MSRKRRMKDFSSLCFSSSRRACFLFPLFLSRLLMSGMRKDLRLVEDVRGFLFVVQEGCDARSLAVV